MEPILLNEEKNIPRADYPRPQWKRESWMCLNGEWDFAFDFGNSGIERGMMKNGEFPLKICVPYCPESKLSGIEHVDFILAVWYRRNLHLDKLPEGRALLHFGAVDYECKVWVNGVLCGGHVSGYTSFEMDITDALKEGDNTIVVYAKDDILSGRQSRGKQSFDYYSHGCIYTRTTGIWQTVWLEFVSESYMLRSKMTPHAADKTLDAETTVVNAKKGDKVKLTAFYDGRKVGEACTNVIGGKATALLEVSECHLWNPGAPEIYDLTVELVDASGNVKDKVESYFALRDVVLNKCALTINGKPVFMRLILDQGYNPDGVYTYPSDEYIKRDIELAMELGFNGARLHERVFEERCLYWADMLGYIVWAEYPCNGVNLREFNALEYILPEWMESVERDYNHPAIIGWCILNESYHHQLTNEMMTKFLYRVTKQMDPYRPVIDASGGQHFESDMIDTHDYEQDAKEFAKKLAPMLEDENYCYDSLKLSHIPMNYSYRPFEYKGQPYWVSEYGGAYWNPQDKEGWGYGKMAKSVEELVERYEELSKVLLNHPRVCGFCYTQLTDVEFELNGLYYYDRTRKFPDWVYDRIRAVNLLKAAVEEEE